MDKLEQKFQVEFTFNVYFTHHLFAIDNPLFREAIPPFQGSNPPSFLFVIDEGFLHHHPNLVQQIRGYFAAHDAKMTLAGAPIIVEGGENAKNETKWIDNILSKVNQMKIDRHSYIVAIGGGAVLDMAGFAAAMAHRGVRLIRVPTTVLSQNDSGVGVKNGVNAFGKKNFLGTFEPPFAVMNDLQFLTTLEDRDWRSGISEAIKVALIKDLDFFHEIEENVEAYNRRDLKAMTSLIKHCAKLHLDHIAGGDPFEKGSSRPLDFGHWAAHKLEQLTDYRIRHGEAVAIGIALDVTYSLLKGNISEENWSRILQLISGLGFDLYAPELHATTEDGTLQVLKGLEEFREHLGGELTIMLLEELGKGVEVHEMDHELIVESLNILERQHAKVTV